MYQLAIANYKKSDAVKVTRADGIAVYNLTMLGNTYRDQAMFDSAQFFYQLPLIILAKVKRII